jgi:hypothetical protein
LRNNIRNSSAKLRNSPQQMPRIMNQPNFTPPPYVDITRSALFATPPQYDDDLSSQRSVGTDAEFTVYPPAMAPSDDEAATWFQPLSSQPRPMRGVGTLLNAVYFIVAAVALYYLVFQVLPGIVATVAEFFAGLAAGAAAVGASVGKVVGIIVLCIIAVFVASGLIPTFTATSAPAHHPGPHSAPPPPDTDVHLGSKSVVNSASKHQTIVVQHVNIVQK